MSRRQKRAERVQRERALRGRADLFRVMSTAEGRRFVRAWLIERTGVYQSTFAQDAIIMAGLAAVQHHGLKFLAECEEVCPELLEKMEAEARAERVSDLREIEAAQSEAPPEPEEDDADR